MNKVILGATLTVGLLLGLNSASFAAGDGLDRDAASQGNSTFAGQHSEARRGATVARPRMGTSRMMRHTRHHRRAH